MHSSLQGGDIEAEEWACSIMSSGTISKRIYEDGFRRILNQNQMAMSVLYLRRPIQQPFIVVGVGIMPKIGGRGGWLEGRGMDAYFQPLGCQCQYPLCLAGEAKVLTVKLDREALRWHLHNTPTFP